MATRHLQSKPRAIMIVWEEETRTWQLSIVQRSSTDTQRGLETETLLKFLASRMRERPSVASPASLSS